MSIPSRVKGAIPVNIMKKVWSKKSRILVASMITFGVISVGEFSSDSPYLASPPVTTKPSIAQDTTSIMLGICQKAAEDSREVSRVSINASFEAADSHIDKLALEGGLFAGGLTVVEPWFGVPYGITLAALLGERYDQNRLIHDDMRTNIEQEYSAAQQVCIDDARRHEAELSLIDDSERNIRFNYVSGQFSSFGSFEFRSTHIPTGTVTVTPFN